MTNPIFRTLLAALALASVSCSSSNDAKPTPGEVDSGLVADVCKDPFAVGGSTEDQLGNSYELIKSAPAVPSVSVQGGNVWTVKMTMASGAEPDGGAPGLDVFCSMPRHAHGCGGTGPRVKALGNGVYEITSLVFIMPGQWYVHFMPHGVDRSDAAQFGVCLN